VIGDPQRVADHVRYVGYRVVAMVGRSDLASSPRSEMHQALD
jgi:hypothetical protein